METELAFVSVILPAHNEQEYLSDCLSSLLDQDYPRSKYEIILVNNGSTDRTVEIAKSFGITVIHQAEGPVGRVRNVGASVAKGELLLFLDSDCVAPRGWISHAVSRITTDFSLVLGGGYDLRPSPKPIERYWLLEGKNGSILPKDLLGGCIAISSTTFSEVRGFDETITSGEDSKFSKTLREHKFKVEIDRKMSVIHLGNPTRISTFFIRQIWHSENYIKTLKDSFSDPTFILVLTFLTILLASLLTVLSDFFIAMTLMLAALFIPLVFSLKRILRSKYLPHLKSLHKIYFIDLLYVIGRSLGILKGLYRSLN